VDEIETNVFKKSSRINSTWGSSLVDMMRFQRYLEIIEEDKLVENAATQGEYLLNKLYAFQDKYQGYISNTRGKGLMCAFDFPDSHARNAFIRECYSQGLMILGCGQNSVRFRPPLTIEAKHIDEGLDIIDRSMKSALAKCPVVSYRIQTTKSLQDDDEVLKSE
jgi:L-lysine 6-transaminase